MPKHEPKAPIYAVEEKRVARRIKSTEGWSGWSALDALGYELADGITHYVETEALERRIIGGPYQSIAELEADLQARGVLTKAVIEQELP
jgi:hypothetical protein